MYAIGKDSEGHASDDGGKDRRSGTDCGNRLGFDSPHSARVMIKQ